MKKKRKKKRRASSQSFYLLPFTFYLSPFTADKRSPLQKNEFYELYTAGPGFLRDDSPPAKKKKKHRSRSISDTGSWKLEKGQRGKQNCKPPIVHAARMSQPRRNTEGRGGVHAMSNECAHCARRISNC